MRREGRFFGGRAADVLNRMHGEQVRRSKISLDNSLDGVDDSSGLSLRGKAKPKSGSIQVKNVGSTVIAKQTEIELTLYHDDSDTHDGKVPTSASLVRTAVCNPGSDIPVGATGTAYALWANPGLMKVIANSTYPDGGAVDTGGWLATAPGTGIAQPTRARTNLKIIGIATPPTPALPAGQTLVWASFMGSLG